MRKRQYSGRDGFEIVVQTDDDVLDHETTHDRLASALATAEDERAAEVIVLQRFKETHEVEKAVTDRSFFRRRRRATIQIRRRPTRIWT